MKLKLRIEELSVASFSTEESTSERGTVRGFATAPTEPTADTCEGLRTCDFSCQGVARTCAETCDTCYVTCHTCDVTCVRDTCG